MSKNNRNRALTALTIAESLEPRRLLAGHVAAALKGAPKLIAGPTLSKTTVTKVSTSKLAAATATGTIADEIVPGGVILRSITPATPLSTSARPVANDSNIGAFDIVLKKGPNLLANAAASAAFDQAALLVEALYSDPVTVVIDAEIAPLGAGILGSTGSTAFTAGYATIRDAVVNARSLSDESIVASLPTAAQFTATIPSVPANPYSLGGLKANRANLLAVGFSQASLNGPNSVYDPAVDVDMTMTFSSNFSFDYDRSNGIGAGLYDFIGVAAHEITHGLGFVSEVDTVDYLQSNAGTRTLYPTTLDLFRLQPGVGSTNFTTGARVLAPGNTVANQVIYDGGAYNPAGIPIAGLTVGDIPMSTGTQNGDTHQASHFKDNAIIGVQIGLMDPTAAGTGVQLNFTNADIRAMGLIGWDTGISFNSATPGTPDLVAATDTGSSSTDNLTNRDNSTAAKNLQFTVTGTVSGATVSLYSGGTFIGSAVASGATTTVTTNGTVDLADGVRSITARQTESGKLASVDSSALPVTIDTVAPGVVSKTLQYLTVKPLVTFVYDTNLSIGDAFPTVVRTSPSPGSVTFSEFLSGTGNIANFSFTSSPNGILPNGRYTANLPADAYRDAAGNSTAATTLDFFVLAGDANHNGTTDFNDFLTLQTNYGANALNFSLGDFNYDGTINFNDFLILQTNYNITV